MSLKARLDRLEKRHSGEVILAWRCSECGRLTDGHTLYSACNEHVVVNIDGEPDITIRWDDPRGVVDQ